MLQLARIAAALCLFVSVAKTQDHAYFLTPNRDQLCGVNLGSLSVRVIGSTTTAIGLGSAAGLAWRSARQELWSYDNDDRQIGVLSPAFLTFSPRAVSGIFRAVQNLCWNPANDRVLLLDYDYNTTRQTLTSFNPTTLQFQTLTSWVVGPPFLNFEDMSCDAAGNVWFLGGNPYGLHVLEAGRTFPRSVCSTEYAFGLAIERASGTYYLQSPDLQLNCSLFTVEPSTGAMQLRGPLGSCTPTFEVIEGACNPALSSYGSGCPGSGGYTPELSATGCYNASGFVHLGLSYAPSGSTALLLFGLAPASFPIGNGCSILIAPIFNDPQIALPLFGSGGAGRGFTAIGISIPPGVVTTSLVTQALVHDPGAIGGLTVTNGVRFG